MMKQKLLLIALIISILSHQVHAQQDSTGKLPWSRN
jgi:hypothetical protein